MSVYIYIHVCVFTCPYTSSIFSSISPIFSAEHLKRIHIPSPPLNLPRPATVIIQASTLIYEESTQLTNQWILYNSSYMIYPKLLNLVLILGSTIYSLMSLDMLFSLFVIQYPHL